jgi:arabinogalactan oligomer/maltooligosaccharide transport system substrate-binding protein
MIYYPIFVAEGGFITAQAREVDGLEDTVLAGADGMVSPDFVEAAGDAGEGMYHTGPNLSFKGDQYQNFLAAHEAKYGEAPLSVFHAHAYDAANMIFDAIEEVGVLDADGNLHIGRKALREAIYATKNFQGITGNLNCDENGDCADPSIAVSQLRGGEYVPIWNDRDGMLEEAGMPAGPPEGATTISIWHGWSGAYLEAIEEAFAEFNETNISGIYVELSKVDNLSDALAVAVPAGEGPDILAWVQDQIGRNAITGNIVPIDEFVDMGFLEGNYEPAAVTAMVWNGQIWGLPESQEGIAIIYNADIAGPDDFPADPFDFDDLLAKATAFRDANPDMYLLCNQGLGATSSDAYHVAPIYFGIGGADDVGYVDDQGEVYINTEARVQAGEWIVEWSKVAPEETSHEVCQAMLVDGQAAAWWTGPWAVADLEAAGVNIGLLPMGRPFAGIKVLMLTANGYDRGNGAAAVEVMKYFTSADVQKNLSLINKTIPANSAALNDPELQAISIIAGYGNSLNLAVPMPNHPFIDAQWGPVGDATAAIFSGAQSPADALNDAQAVAEETVAGIKGE